MATKTNPIGGFEADHQLAEAFDVDPERYVPVMILSIGKAEELGYESIRLDAKKSRHLNKSTLTFLCGLPFVFVFARSMKDGRLLGLLYNKENQI